MSYALDPFADIPLTESLLRHLLDDHERVTLPRLNRLWRYYRNPLADPAPNGRTPQPPAQSVGLPARFDTTGTLRLDRASDRSIVIENDIAWRLHTLVDFMFPRPPKLVSKAADGETRRLIEAVLDAVFDANGGAGLWQNAALLGSVYGSIDFLLDTASLEDAARSLGSLRRRHSSTTTTPSNQSSTSTSSPTSGANGAAPSKPLPTDLPLEDLARTVGHHIVIETIEAPRSIALVRPEDYRQLDAFILHFRQPAHDVSAPPLLERLTRRISGRSEQTARRTIEVTEVHSASLMQRYENGALIAERHHRLGRIPLVHVQNLHQPLRWEGLSDVEPLIPLQDELNTRLSDRANRVTMQSFRMWLGKGIEGFTERPVGPGQMWVTDNPDASIEVFGGDADSPSEREHIEELREALDKASGVTPAAAGHIRARIGNLTSENALRISLMGTIAKTKRKRITYGAGIEQLCELVLHALDVHGVVHTKPADRRVDVTWADPLPPDESRRISDALAKAQLGVPLEVLRAELGYVDEPARSA